MEDGFSRTRLLLGAAGVERLNQAHVAIFGIGGVGGHVVEALARSGVGKLDLIDRDVICLSNLNRQIIATQQTIGRPKVEVACERVLAINPRCQVRQYPIFYTPETAGQFDFAQYDYVVDAIDTVTGKLALVMQAKQAMTPIISCMGAGNKLDPTAFRVADINKTSVCPLARVMRKELRRRGVNHLKVVFSTEDARVPEEDPDVLQDGRKQTPGSVAFVPAVAGLILAGEVIRDLVAGEAVKS